MAPATKSRRGGKAAKGKGKSAGKAAAKAASNGGEKLSVAERRLEGHSVGDRRKAVKLANSDGVQAAADFLGTTTIKAKYLVMQQQVEDGDVSAISPTNEAAIVKAIKSGGDHGSVAWVACRTGLSDGRVKAIAEESGHSFERGRPRESAAPAAKKGKSAAAKKGKAGSKARRGGKARRGKVSSPNA